MTCTPFRSVTDLQSDDLFDAISFHGDTLKRKWLTALELIGVIPGLIFKDILIKKLSAFGVASAVVERFLRMDTATLMRVSAMHFLAGTRSWRVGYDVKTNQLFVETIALERFSCEHYRVADELHSTRRDVLDLWDNLLNNFLHHTDIAGYRFNSIAAPSEFSAYEASEVNPHIQHKAFEFEDHAALVKESSDGSPVMTAILLNHPGLKHHLRSI